MVKNSASDLPRPKRSIFMVFFLFFSTNSVHLIYIEGVDNVNNRVLLICSRMRKLFRGRIPMKVMKLNYEASSSTLDLILYSYFFFLKEKKKVQTLQDQQNLDLLLLRKNIPS